MRIFLDANILFSAAKSDGAVRELLRLLRVAGHECRADEYVIVEARRNLAAKGPGALAIFEALVSELRPGQERMPGTSVSRTDIDWLPEKDRPVLAAAIRLGCHVLLTGDRTHFGTRFGNVCGGVTIHSPRSLALSLFSK